MTLPTGAQPGQYADLGGKHVAVTGGSRGIGLAVAIACRRSGARVTILARSERDLAEARELLGAAAGDQPVLALAADVTDDSGLRAALKSAAAEQGAIYGLICGSGIYGPIGPFADTDFDAWERTIAVNLVGTARTVHAALPFMSSPHGGRIILFSGGGQGPLPNFSGYVSSKGAIWRLTETLGTELAPRRIFLNAIAPGAVNTRLLDELLEAGPDRVGADFYAKSIAQRESGGQGAEKAAALCQFLLSEAAAGLHGRTLSAVWDPYHDLTDLDLLSSTDLFTYRRVIDDRGGTRV